MISRNIQNYTDIYLQKNYSFEEFMVKIRRKQILKYLKKYKAKNILEIGCGMDSIANHYVQFENFYIVEPSKIFFEHAKKNLKNIKIINDFVENSIKTLKNQNFDFIIISGLLHEVINPQMFLQEVIKVCNKNTLLHINVPNSKSFHLLWAYQSGLLKALGDLTPTAHSLQQNTTFDLEKLISYCNTLGLKILDKGSYFIKPFNHSKMTLCIKENIIDEKLLLGLEKMIKYMPDFGAEIFVNCKLVKPTI